jgi:hypothetical protein
LRGKSSGKNWGKKVRGKSRDFRWRHFWSSMRTVSLPVAPHRSSTNVTLFVPIFYLCPCIGEYPGSNIIF